MNQYNIYSLLKYFGFYLPFSFDFPHLSLLLFLSTFGLSFSSFNYSLPEYSWLKHHHLFFQNQSYVNFMLIWSSLKAYPVTSMGITSRFGLITQTISSEFHIWVSCFCIPPLDDQVNITNSVISKFSFTSDMPYMYWWQYKYLESFLFQVFLILRESYQICLQNMSKIEASSLLFHCYHSHLNKIIFLLEHSNNLRAGLYSFTLLWWSLVNKVSTGILKYFLW